MINKRNEIENILNKLSKSNFRNKFHLKEKDKEYIKEKGIEKIKEHAYTFINKRLAPKDIPNDGKQTPMKGHPVFISQHATATCCRNCLYKWHKIEPQKELNKEQIDYIIDEIMIGLSIKEPFATLIKEGKKKIETRSWKTSYRGELYIHASSTKIPREWKEDKTLMKLLGA